MGRKVTRSSGSGFLSFLFISLLDHDHLSPKSLPCTAAHLLMMLDQLVEEKVYVL